MEVTSPLSQFAATDPTWQRAHEVAQSQLKVHNAAWQLIRTAWHGALEPKDFIRMLGFSRLNINCLIDAAELLNAGSPLDAALVERALQTLGIRLCSVVLAINYTCQTVLAKKPPPLWKKLLQDTMTCVEIGYKLGAKASSLGIEGGALMGFSCHAGNLLLLAYDPSAYRKWTGLTKPEGKVAVDIFGCEPYQVSAFALQQLGFGHEVAIGAAVGNGRLDSKLITLDELTNLWKAALLWIDALREGRGYPAAMEIRQFFSEVTPPKEQSVKNPVLDVLYTEVARAKSEGSKWTWHLPKPSYDQTEAVIK